MPQPLRLDTVTMESLRLLLNMLKDRGAESLPLPPVPLDARFDCCKATDGDQSLRTMACIDGINCERVLRIDVIHAGKMVGVVAQFPTEDLYEGLDYFSDKILKPLVLQLCNRIAPIVVPPYTKTSTGLIGHQVYL